MRMSEFRCWYHIHACNELNGILNKMQIFSINEECCCEYRMDCWEQNALGAIVVRIFIAKWTKQILFRFVCDLACADAGCWNEWKARIVVSICSPFFVELFVHMRSSPQNSIVKASKHETNHITWNYAVSCSKSTCEKANLPNKVL